MFLVTAVALLLSFQISDNMANKAIDDAYFSKLEALKAAKSDQISLYFETLAKSLQSYASSKDVLDLYDELVQYHHDTNVSPKGNYDVETEAYRDIWKNDGSYITDYCEAHGYPDIYLICAAHGHVMYSSARRSDLGQNLEYSSLKNSGLAHIRKMVLKNNGLAFEDFQPYEPLGGKVAAFMGVPVRKDGQTIGVLVLQMSSDGINEIMNERAGMGETGESYLATREDDGSYTFRSTMQTMGNGKYVIGASIPPPAYWEEAFKTGKENSGIYEDSAGNEVVVSYTPLNVYGRAWALFTKMDMSEIDIPIIHLRNTLFKVILLFIILAAAIAWFFGSSISKGIHRVLEKIYETIRQVIEGHLNIQADKSGVTVDFREIIDGLNQLIRTYVGHLDNINAPVMIIDRDYRIRFMNRAGAALGKTTGDALKGSKCYDFFRTGDCNTANCACNRAMSDDRPSASETDAHPGDLSLRIGYNGIPVKNQSGEIVGALEVVMDQTDSWKAMQLVQKQNQYQGVEVEKLLTNLGKVGEGNFEIQTDVAEADSDTFDISTNFIKINEGLRKTVDTLEAISTEFNQIAEAAELGRLTHRGNSDAYLGHYARIVEIVNEVLDQVINPVNESIAVMKSVSDRDLRSRVTGDYAGDLDDFKTFINTAIENLDMALNQVAEGVVQVSSASDQISRGSQNLAEGANEQASSLEEISSSLEQMASMTNQNADYAKQANGLSQEANDFALQGNSGMKKMMEAVNRIKESSDETAKIVKTIDEIAFQTNLLALNAAVEAARAGDAGKGFAVVAEEVRNLAQRSAEAAKNTSAMIQESVENADEGVATSREVAELLEHIDESSGKVKTLVAEIAAASKEQAAGIEQVNTAVAQLNQVTQQNAANSEESASAAEELNSQAAQLTDMVRSFSLSENRVEQQPTVKKQVEMPRTRPAIRKIVSKPEKVISLDNDEFGDF